jgi:hypothetical protein
MIKSGKGMNRDGWKELEKNPLWVVRSTTGQKWMVRLTHESIASGLGVV